MRRLTPEPLVVALVRNYTPKELCELWEQSDAVDGCKYLDALGLYARKTSWGDLVAQSINGWKEEHLGKQHDPKHADASARVYPGLHQA